MTYKKIMLLCLFLGLVSGVIAGENVLYKKNDYIFKQSNADELLELAEFLGRARLSLIDRKALQLWSIQDFKSFPKKAVKYYQVLGNTIIPKIRHLTNIKERNAYRTNLYLGYFNLFRKKPEYKKLVNNFMAVIDRYNPPIQEALVLQRLNHNIVMQQLKLNQMIFNQAMRSQQETSDRVVKSIRDNATRDSIRTSGGTVLYETESRFYARDRKGRKYNLAK